MTSTAARVIIQDLRATVAGLAFGAWEALADTFLFHRPLVYVAPAAWGPAVILDEVMRAGVIQLLRWARVPAFDAVLLVAFVGYPLFHWSYYSSLPPDAAVWWREVLLHFAAGTLWGTIYVRYGFVAATLAHGAAHVSLNVVGG